MNIKHTLIASTLLSAPMMALADTSEPIILTSPNEYYVTALSANGDWACGVFMDYSSQAFAFRWNLLSDEIEILGTTEESEAFGIANDGTTIGCFTDHSYSSNGIGRSMAGYYKEGKWHLLEPVGGDVSYSRAHAITPDGQYITGTQVVGNIYGAYIWKDGKLHRTLEDTKHALPYAIHPEGEIAAGWVQRYNRTACLWNEANETVILSDYESPWSYGRAFTEDGKTLLYWGGWEENAEGRAELAAIYDLETGNVTNIPTINPEGGLDVFGISNDKTVVGAEDYRGYIYADGKAQYINDYLTDRGIDLSKLHIGMFEGMDYYVISSVAGISADGKTLAIQYYNDDVDSDGLANASLQSMVIRFDQSVSMAKPVSLHAEQLDGIPAVRLTWKAPAGAKDITGYRVFRDGKEVKNVTETSYIDSQLQEQTYVYTVSTLYADGESEPCSAATITIEGQKVQAPSVLYGRQKGYNSAYVTWEKPRTNLINKTYFDRDNTNIQGFGVNINNICFENAIRFSAEEMKAYAGCKVREVAFYPMSEQESWKVNLYTYDAEGKLSLLYTQKIEQELNYGYRNTVRLNEAVDVPDGELIVAVEINVPVASERIIGIDYGQATQRYSDLLRRTDEADFYSLCEINALKGYLYEASWLIEATLAPAGSDEDIDTVAEYVVSADGKEVARTEGYDFTVQNLADGTHSMEVSSVYADGRVSENAVYSVNILADNSKLPAISQVYAQAVGASGVHATWHSPKDADETTITYASGEITDRGVVGPESNNYGVIAGVLYTPNMLKSYNGYQLKSFSFVPMADAMFTIILLQDNVQVAEIEVDDYTLGEWNEVMLDTPITINENSTYLYAIDCYDVTPNGHAIAVDAGPAVQFYSDLYSLDGSYWSSIGADASIYGNWMMSMNIYDDDPMPLTVNGYDINIDNEKRNAEMLTSKEFDFTFPTEDSNVHTVSVDVYYPALEAPVKGTLCEFHIGTAGIHDVTDDAAELSLTIGDNFLCVDNADSLTLVSADGTVVASSTGNRLNISNLVEGVYVLFATVKGEKMERKVRITR